MELTISGGTGSLSTDGKTLTLTPDAAVPPVIPPIIPVDPPSIPPVIPPSMAHTNEPVGLKRFAETDYSSLTLPPIAGHFSSGAKPSGLLQLLSTGGGLGMIFEPGTPPGYQAAGGDYMQAFLWSSQNPMAGNEYSSLFEETYFTVAADGSGSIECPPPGIKPFGYYGVAVNNQNSSGSGPTQLYAMAVPERVAKLATSSAPMLVSEFSLDMCIQIGTSLRFAQNMNLGKNIVVGTKHKFTQQLVLNTPGQANGVWNWWLDDVQIGSYKNIRFIDSAFRDNAGNGTGLSGFFGLQRSPYWGGQGGPKKTRADAITFQRTYLSGLFLRASGN
jgi:hypothetical protein